MKFRKKPVVIDAVQFLGTEESGELVVNELSENLVIIIHDGDHWELDIPTLEGTMIANPGDWVIRGIAGELYPCKPDIFEATYEAVVGEQSPGHIDDHTDADWLNATNHLESCRSQIEESAFQFLKANNIGGQPLYEKKMAEYLTNFATQEIAEFIGLNDGENRREEI